MTVTASKVTFHISARSHLSRKSLLLFSLRSSTSLAVTDRLRRSFLQRMMVPQPKQLDLGGERAWQGGCDAIRQCDVRGAVYWFVKRRLQAFTKVLNQPDPTAVANLNFGAMLQAVEYVAPDQSFHYDHNVYRGLYAKYDGALTPEEAQQVSDWEASVPGQYVIGQMRAVLSTGWRDVPSTVFGDSAATNHFNSKKRTMIAYINQWLSEYVYAPERKMGKMKDFIQGGNNIIDWVNAFEKNKDVIAPEDQVFDYDPAKLSEKYGSVRSDAPPLRSEPFSENPWLGPNTHL